MHKTIITYILLSLAVMACTPKKQETKPEDPIKAVETSLSPAVHIIGDSVWTIESRMKHYGVPGVSIAVIADGKIAWSKAYGIKDRETNEPVTTSTLFQAGSISKPVAAYAALKEMQLGKIDGDQNVNTYLTSWKVPDNDFTKQQPVTLKNILSHTGGLTVHGFLGYSPDLPVPTLLQVLNGTPPANSPPIFVDKLPGQSFRYSGGGYTVMQQMLIDLEGKPFPEILQELVLTPLNMSHSTYDQPLTGDQLTAAATGYLPDGSQTKGKRHTYPEMAAAGLWTTAEDLAKFAIDIQQTYKGESNKVLSQATVKEMLTPFIKDSGGLGIFVNDNNGKYYFQHGGWDEGFSSQMTALRDKGMGVVVLTNSNHPPFIDELIRAVALTYQWPNYVATYTQQPMSAADRDAAIGKYFYTEDEVIKVYEEGDRLFFTYLRSDPMELIKVSDSSYVRRERTSPIVFKTNPADGKQYLVFLEGTPEERFTHPKMSEGERVPFEHVLDGDVDKAISAYRELKKRLPDDPDVQEGTINGEGYDLMSQDKTALAAILFHVNISLYPNSSNAYDSYADALLKLGNKKEAIENYKKALQLNPKQEETRKKLEEAKK